MIHVFPIAVPTSTSRSLMNRHTNTHTHVPQDPTVGAQSCSRSLHINTPLHCIHLTFFYSSLIALFSRFFVSPLFLLINLVKELFLREIVQWNSVLVAKRALALPYMIPNNNKWDFFSAFENIQSCSHQSYMDTQ